jgi:hypothetical protein
MLARLGSVLYWTGCGLAVVALLSGIFLLQHGNSDYRLAIYALSCGGAAALWLIGRACKYFLAGE